MKAAFIRKVGPPETIQYGDLPDPIPTGQQVLVRTTAVALNPVDTYVRSGAIQFDLPQPFIVGCDLAGVVEAVGPAAVRFQVGDRVWGTNQGLLGRQGTFAELCAVDEQWLYPIPEGVADTQVAALALVGITAHLGLFREAHLSTAETIVVQGGSGGVGSTVIQLAKAAGARVLATAGSPHKAAICRELGADQVVEYRREDLLAAVEEFAPGGANVFWETQREPDFDRIISCLSDRGRIVLMAGREARPEFPVGPFYVKECRLSGFVMFKATAHEQRQSAEFINELLAADRLCARIDRVLPLADTAAAHRLQEESTVERSGAVAGKIVLKP